MSIVDFQDLTESLIQKIAKSRGMYHTPKLNEALLLHCLSLRSVQPLPQYGHVTNLVLEKNALSSLGGLDQFPRLRYLNLNHNAIGTIDLTCELLNLSELEELHLCHNAISRFIISKDMSVSFANTLRKLMLSKNRLTEFPDVSQLRSLEILDISGNSIDTLSPTDFTTCLTSRLPKSLQQLYMSPNPFIANIKQYRKHVIVTLDWLKFLDTAEVEEEEIEVARAEISGGAEAGVRVRKVHAEKSRLAMQTQMDSFRDFQRQSGSSPAPPDELTQLRREIEILINSQT